MQFFIAVTDNSWFDFLSKLQPDEVNFWRPSGKGFKAIEIGAPFLFKLHSPLNYIVGGGYFVRSEELPLSLVWNAFREKNGAPDLISLRKLIGSHRDKMEIDTRIGCIILNEPFFLPREQWIPAPKDWSGSIVVGKSYDSEMGIGKEIWKQVEKLWLPRRAWEPEQAGAFADRVSENKPVYGNAYLTKARLGQGTFRVMVTDAYQYRCAVTGEKTLPVLEAAHIKPVSESGPNRVSNGLLLRSDLHILFDQGYLTVSPDYHVEISHKIKEEFDNGKEYYPLHGKKLLILPPSLTDRPSLEFLKWHNEKVFV